MAQILPFKKLQKKHVFRRRKRRNTFLAVPVWVSLVAAIAYSNFDSGQFVDSPLGPARITADQKFTFCSADSQRYCVVDGDTIHFAGTKIRIEDIDTPDDDLSPVS